MKLVLWGALVLATLCTRSGVGYSVTVSNSTGDIIRDAAVV
jgi:hypothetical protein